MGEIPILIQVAAIVLGPAGAAWAGVRVSLNGTRQDVRDIKTEVSGIRGDVSNLRERVARVEGRQ